MAALTLLSRLAGGPSPEEEDARSLLLQVVANQERNEDLQRQYAYLETVTTEHLRGDGTVARRESETFEVTPSPDGEYRRLVARNGRPLPPDESRREEEKLRKHLDKLLKMSPAEREKAGEKIKRRSDRFKTRLREAVEVYDFTPLPEEEVDGQPVRVFSFSPRPGYRPHSKSTRILEKLEGKVWIDPARSQIVKLHLAFTEDLKFAGGLFGQITRGSQAVAEQQKVGEEIWLLKSISALVRARLYFLKRYNRRVTSSYSDFRKFTVEATEQDFRKAPEKRP